jgi:hypothetical protein
MVVGGVLDGVRLVRLHVVAVSIVPPKSRQKVAAFMNSGSRGRKWSL